MALATKRSVLKSSIIKISKIANEVPDGADVFELESAFDRLNELFTKFEDVHMSILEITGKENLDFEIIEYSDTEALVLASKAKLKRAIKALQPQQEPQLPPQGDNLNQNRNDFSGLRVPRMEVPEFTGSYLEWPSFRDLFLSLVGNNPKVPNVQKLSYLKTIVVGETSKLIKNIKITNDNYQAAWDLLEGRFENDRLVVHELLENIYSIPNATGSADGIKLILDTTMESIRELNNLNRPTAEYSDWLVFLIVKKLDSLSLEKWNELIGDERAVIEWTKLEEFLNTRFRILEGGEPDSKRTPSHQNLARTSCHVSESHAKRESTVKKANHSSTQALESSSSSSSSASIANHLVDHIIDTNKDILLATAVIVVNLGSGKKVFLKALLDQGSQMSLISTFAAKRLKLQAEVYQGIPLTAAGGEKIETRRGIAEFSFGSRINDSQFQTTALLVDTVTRYQHSNYGAFPEACRLFPKIELADPEYEDSSRIDVLLAGDVYSQVVLDGVKKFCGILVQNTSLGWILSGQYNAENRLMPSINIHQMSFPLEQLLRSFWEIEEIQPDERSLMSVDELACEKFYEESHHRKSTGRYVVRLPFKLVKESKELGYSRGLAVSSQIRMENRFEKNPVLKEKYHKFMDESVRLGHMELVSETDLQKSTSECFYMPHHAVLRESSTTSLRVVFNASQKSSTGVSLNELLHTGPKLQSNLFDILVRYRKHKVCYMADVEKMYRRIFVHKKDRDYQRIVWRKDVNQPLKTYRMRVVTDGMSSSPFLAIRTVRQLAEDEKENFPLAYEPIMTDLFMDDLVSGSKDISSGIKQIRDINNIFKSGGMHMRKWSSNFDDVLTEISPEDRQSSPIEFSQDEIVKVLGIQWSPSTDTFGFKVRLPPVESTTTKRKFLSHASKLFDPLGFMAPCTVIPKILFQRLWETKLKWDDLLPDDIRKRWVKFHGELPLLESIQIPRFFGLSDDIGSGAFELHGFSDASGLAYSGVVYTRVQHPDGTIQVQLLAAKTKVAPVKRITIHCGELCGALLVSRLLKKVLLSLKVADVSVYGWTDSEVVLGWLKKSPGTWQQFVGNRTAQILDIVPFHQWGYVESSQNPADCASRGIMPSQLVSHPLWWKGPSWLSEAKSQWPSTVNPLQLSTTDIMKKKSIMNLVAVDPRNQLLERYSSLRRLVRITAWCMRFVTNIRQRISDRSGGCQSSAQPVWGLRKQNLHHGGLRKCMSRHPNTDLNSVQFLTAVELRNALKIWIRVVQESAFGAELKRLRANKPVRRGKLRKLNPKYDHQEGVIRVGGRLTNAHISYDQKFPIVLPNDGSLTQLLIADAHIHTLHGNVQLMLQYLRQHYWIFDSRRIVRSFIKNRCKTCLKWSSTKQKQQMAPFPRPRVQASISFTFTGVDFAGPVYIKDKGRGKNQSLSKGYIAVFICLSTKAIHLEAAEDLSTREFIETYKRFVSRRGKPSKMHSDHGSNFVGCTTELTKAQERAMRQQMGEIAALLADDGIEWEFNPPTASHFGGIWEAAVKSMKFHLKRIVGSAHLTFKELTTLLCQIECALNSRPICSLTDDVDDLNFLTPGHFTMGRNPTTLPEESFIDINENRLTKWQRLQQMYQNFWSSWSKEYLSNLSDRSKWFDTEDNLKIGELVILKEDDLPPTKWLMGRVIEVHPGGDNLVRAVTVRLKCKHHTLTRPIHKLCRLPFLRSDELDVGL
ncbi:uncharacterized protein LOC119072036 [Bradysia coprophila]|uniref:uncharacterized protein LOC119072036 n=1 Tax=Bradysia coprophila TaxID=38358 RepID=UPI00187D8356|nr:uncharacterized protein LOC119072036 [Bradysia coprophila]